MIVLLYIILIILYLTIARFIYHKIYREKDKPQVKVKCALMSLTWIISIPMTILIFFYIITKKEK